MPYPLGHGGICVTILNQINVINPFFASESRAVASLVKLGGGTTERQRRESCRGFRRMLPQEILKNFSSENVFPGFQTLFETKSVSKTCKIFPVFLRRGGEGNLYYLFPL